MAHYFRRRSVRMALGGLVGLGAMGWGGQTLYANSSQSSPDYLTPFYLRSFKSRHAKYASHGEGSHKSMTAVDFVNSLLANPTRNVIERAPADLEKLFLELDANGDGRLDYGEYALIMTLLTTPVSKYELAFHVFDDDGNGKLSHAEFANLLRALCPDKGALSHRVFDSPLMTRFFGEKRDKAIDFPELWSFIEFVRVKVWQAEFNHYSGVDDRMSGAQFLDMLNASGALGSHTPFALVAHRRKLDEIAKHRGQKATISQDQYVKLMHMLAETDTLSELIDLYERSAQPLDVAAFHRIVRVVLGGSRFDPHKKAASAVTAKEIRFMFDVFDIDGDGTLNSHEFMQSLMGPKASWNVPRKVAGVSEEHKGFVGRFVHCMRAAAV